MKKYIIGIIILVMILVVVCPIIDTFAAETDGFVTTNGTQFVLDGKPFYFAGVNAYNLFTFGDGAIDHTGDYIENLYMDKKKIDSFMSDMAEDGVKVVRTWGFSTETWHGFEISKGEYNEKEFMLFDYIMVSAKNHGIKLIITLENYWEAYGGIDSRLKWEGLPYGNHNARTEFFRNEELKAGYKAYAERFINRVNHYTGINYKDDTTIFAWELMNEPRYQDATINENSTGTTLRAWVDEMAGYIKSLDPNHMVGTGIEGHEAKYGFGGDEGNPFINIHESPYIDFCSAHPYPDEPWANLSPDQTRTLVKAWIDDAHQVVKKPIIIGEFNSIHDKEEYWNAVFDTVLENDAAGVLLWNYNYITQSHFCITHGDPLLSTVFKPFSQKMEAKNVGPVIVEPEYVVGDLNGDGNTNSIDFGLCKQYLLGMIKSFTYKYGLEAADVNGDGKVNSIDFGVYKQFLLGIIKEFTTAK